MKSTMPALLIKLRNIKSENIFNIKTLLALSVSSAICLMAFQTYHDRMAAEERAHQHIEDVSLQIKKSLLRYFAANRQLAEAISDEIERTSQQSATCQIICQDDLFKIERRFTESGLLPNTGLLVTDPHGRLSAETRRSMHRELKAFPTLIQRIGRGERTVILYDKNTLNTPAFVIGQGVYDAYDKLKAIIAVTQPYDALTAQLDQSLLTNIGLLAIYTNKNQLLARIPYQSTIAIGGTMPTIDLSHPAKFNNSFIINSKLDDQTRLATIQTVPFAKTHDSLNILVGIDTNEYLREWHQSATINLFLSMTLLLGWFYAIKLKNRSSKLMTELHARSEAAHKILKESPTPIFLTNKQNNKIELHNRATIEKFGSLADMGEPISKLFSEPEDYQLFLDEKLNTKVIEMHSRDGLIHAELHQTTIKGVLDNNQEYLLINLIDVTETYHRTQKLQQEATIDTLTGLANRRYFHEHANSLVNDCQQHAKSLIVLGLDIDFFKRVNDQYGHDAGDVVLAVVARIFKKSLREGDIAARLGGEEFAALLPNASQEQAHTVGERIRQSIAATPIILPDGQTLGVTISIGVGQWLAADEDIQAALKRADLALYRAKESGRNRVEVYGEAT